MKLFICFTLSFIFSLLSFGKNTQFYYSQNKEFQRFKLAGHEKNFCQKNQCECYIFIHGKGDHSLTWRKLFRKIPSIAGKRYIAFDLPGIKTSDQLEQFSQSLANTGYLRGSAKLLTSFFPSSCTSLNLIGNSLGGWLSLWVNYYSKVKIEKIFLLAPVGVKTNKKSKAQALLEKPTTQSLQEFLRLSYFNPPKLSQKALQKIVQRMKKTSSDPTKTYQTRPSDYQWQTPNLLKNSPKVTFFWGEADQLLAKEIPQIFKSRLPLSKHIILKRCGHMPQKECPENILKELIKN